jgi:acetate kinase
MNDAILVLNAGSSSIKFSIFTSHEGALELYLRGQIEGLFTKPHFIAKDRQGKVLSEKSWPQATQLGHEGAVEHLRLFLREQLANFHVLGAGHRVAHGGLKYAQPTRVDGQVLAELEALTPLVPLHQPHNLMPIRFLLDRAPDLPQVACFDTAFHRTNPLITQLFALPKAMTAAGLRRYGFHGLSYEYIASVLPKYDPRAAAGKTVVLHLGNGSSMCALDRGQSVTSSMGFSSLEGVPMGTRCGSLDPGVILFLLEQRQMQLHDLERLLYSESGLLGVSGLSGDVRTLLESDAPDAKMALDLYVYRIGRELGSLAAALRGLDALIFTAGIGENAVAIRERVCRDAAWLGVELDAAANAKGGPRITTAHSRVTGWVIPTNEELMIATHTQRLLAGVEARETTEGRINAT